MSSKLAKTIIVRTGEQHEQQPKDDLVCPLCNKRMAKKYNLRMHMMIHTGERPFSCDICFKQYICFSELKRHRRVHVHDAEFMCLVCGIQRPCDENPTKCATCAAKEPKRHKIMAEMVVENMKIVQNGDKKLYICPVCDRQHTHITNLKRHYLTHTGAKPYKCEFCGKCVRDISNLKQHVRTHHANGGKQSRTNSASIPEQILHPAGAEPAAGFGTSTAISGLTFDCSHCGDKFTTISSYTKHLKVHTSGFTFQCFICKEMVETKDRLKAHFAEHDKEDD